MIPLDPAILAAWSFAAIYLALCWALTRRVIFSHGGWSTVPRKGLLCAVAILMPVIFLIAILASLPAAIRQTRIRFRHSRRRGL